MSSTCSTLSSNWAVQTLLVRPLCLGAAVEAADSCSGFDNVLELLTINGVLSLPEAVMLLVPEAWQDNADMEPEKIAFYKCVSLFRFFACFSDVCADGRRA